jgi:hypothetical protein
MSVGGIAINTPNYKLGDISFRLETKIMNFMCVFFLKKYNQETQVLSIICNIFAEFGFVFIDFITYFRF